MSQLHPTTKAIWRAIAAYTRKQGYAPTIREIGTAIKRPDASAVIHHHLRILEQSGALEITPGIARGIVLRKQPGELLNVKPGTMPKPAARERLHLYEYTAAAGVEVRTRRFSPSGMTYARAAGLLYARAFFWSEVMDCALYELVGIDDTFWAVGEDGRCVAQVWIAPADAFDGILQARSGTP